MSTQILSCIWAQYFSLRCYFCYPPISFTTSYLQAYVNFMGLFWFCNTNFHFNWTNHWIVLLKISFFLFRTFLLTLIILWRLQLRFGIQCITFLLTLAQRKLISLPVVYIVKWCLGRYVSCGKYQFDLRSKIEITFFFQKDWKHFLNLMKCE